MDFESSGLTRLIVDSLILDDDSEIRLSVFMISLAVIKLDGFEPPSDGPELSACDGLNYLAELISITDEDPLSS